MQRNIEIQTLKSEHSQEVSNWQMQAMDATEQLRLKYEGQLDSVRKQLETVQFELKARSSTFEQQNAGK